MCEPDFLDQIEKFVKCSGAINRSAGQSDRAAAAQRPLASNSDK
jgi:hypothetical protein